MARERWSTYGGAALNYNPFGAWSSGLFGRPPGSRYPGVRRQSSCTCSRWLRRNIKNPWPDIYFRLPKRSFPGNGSPLNTPPYLTGLGKSLRFTVWKNCWRSSLLMSLNLELPGSHGPTFVPPLHSTPCARAAGSLLVFIGLCFALLEASACL